MKYIVELNEKQLLCREDEHGNFWPIQCRENAVAVGLPWDDAKGEVTRGAMFFGCAIVGPNGDETEARKNSLRFYTREAGASIRIVKAVLEDHDIQENIARWRESQRRRKVRVEHAAFTHHFNPVFISRS